MAEHTDIAIVGGAVMGSAVAYFLAQDPDFDGTVTVIERDPTYAACATTRWWGGIRQQFSTPENVRMSLFGADFARGAAQALAVEGLGPDLAFQERGYLFLADAAQIAALGAEVVALTPDQIGARFPWLDLAGLAGAGFGLRNEGWIDPNALLHGLRRKALSLGVRYVADTVTGIALDGGRTAGVDLRAAGAAAQAHELCVRLSDRDHGRADDGGHHRRHVPARGRALYRYRLAARRERSRL